MSRLSAFLRSSRTPSPSSKSHDDALAFSATQTKYLTGSLSKLDHLMNGDADKAWQLLQEDKESSSSSPNSFHLYASSLVIFFRAILGFEKPVMAEAQVIFARTEEQATADLRKAQKLGDPPPGSSAGRAGVYPPGTEFELIRAEVQLMAAVVGVLHESLVEAMRGFNKVRKAYIALGAIIEAEKSMLPKRPSTATTQGVTSAISKLDVREEKDIGVNQEGEEEDDFVDARETLSVPQSPMEPPTSNGTVSEDTAMPSDLSVAPGSDELDASSLTHPLDVFIHSGANLCFGFLLVALSLVPPSFSRILSLVGFRGDRPQGITMMWRASAQTTIRRHQDDGSSKTNGKAGSQESHSNVNAGLSGMVLFGYYNVMLSTLDIVPPPSVVVNDPGAQAVGAPREKLHALLISLRARYPDSSLWMIEESREYALNKDLQTALKLLQEIPADLDKGTKQIAAMRSFEMFLNGLYIQDWDLMRNSALKSMDINEWSPCVYLYAAGCASLEKYRDAYLAGDDNEARREKAKAEKHLLEAPKRAGKKKFLARQLPIEVFIAARIAKWEDRLNQWKSNGSDDDELSLADAVGTSPAAEFCYMWNGMKKMQSGNLEKLTATLQWDRLTIKDANKREAVELDKGDDGLRGLVMSACLRHMGKYDEARHILDETVFKHEWTDFKAAYAEDSLYPQALYEKAALAWDQSCESAKDASNALSRETGWANAKDIAVVSTDRNKATEGEKVDTRAGRRRSASELSPEERKYQEEKVDECEKHLTRVKNWGKYSLDARVGLKVSSGLETIKWWRDSHKSIEGDRKV